MEAITRSEVDFLQIPITVTVEDYERYKQLLIKLGVPRQEIEQRLRKWCERYGL